mmetsp:Transcript_1283/g.2637  ORF Transcript_1283/g.2637 Transcript_1283/m.2637 type:complete len:207 (-) Transcript_1283:78-698(-)
MAGAATIPGRGGKRRATPGATGLLAALALWAAAPGFIAFCGTPAPGVGPAAAPRPSASSRSLVSREAGRDWRPGNTPKKLDFRQGIPKLGEGDGGKKKGGGGKNKYDGVPPPPINKGAKIIYNNKVVGELNGTLTEYKVDIWSGAHPIWQGKKGKVLLDASSVTKFQEKFGAMADIFGDTGMEQLKMNEQLKKEQEENARMGLKVY